ncbi:MAG: LysR family transcriptional regulator, partial [Oscillospiraceae bacterium]|nr:LysR family transcriptional regulator [Oscillospiraceae bacterium]
HEGLHFDNVIYTSNMPAIIDLVSAGYGAAFIFEPHLRHHPAAIDCYSFGEPRMASNFVAAYRKGAYLPIYAKDFIELTRQLYWKV